MPNNFARELIKWGESVDRNMPWKKTNDPYKIWLSEIILQQTRVAQGLPYYLKFVDAFPTVQDLANAHIDGVLKLWEGLGYYSRARNLHFSAKYICQDLGGVFPKTYKELLNLKGVGDYTASAISSFAFGEPRPVLDGNVARLITRVWGIESPIDKRKTILEIKNILAQKIDPKQPGKFNQSIMDFGATYCTPHKPKCSQGFCIFMDQCQAYKRQLIDVIPHKSKKTVRKKRHFHYFKYSILNNKTIIKKRENKDIWQGLYDFPLVEKNNSVKLTKSEIKAKIKEDLNLNLAENPKVKVSKAKKHLLTHQEIYAVFYTVELNALPTKLADNFLLIDTQNAVNFAFPRILTKML